MHDGALKSSLQFVDCVLCIAVHRNVHIVNTSVSIAIGNKTKTSVQNSGPFFSVEFRIQYYVDDFWKMWPILHLAEVHFQLNCG